MHNSQSIGALAENIIALSFRLDGTVTPIVRQRDASGRMLDIASRCDTHELSGPTEFVARVEKGNSAVAAIGPGIWKGAYAVAVVPLGNQPGSAAHELLTGAAAGNTSSADAGGANADEIRFRLADGRLTWRSENLSGETMMNETYPELTVALRLPPGQHGEISFATPLFTNADGEPARVLSVA